MRDRCVAGDDQVEARHHGGGVDEGIRAIVEIVAERLHGHVRRQVLELIQAVVLLQADQADPWKFR